MLKKLTFLFFLCGFLLFSQEEPVKLVGRVKHVAGNEYDLVIDFEIDEDWCVYSQDLPEGGPIPTQIMFEESTDFVLAGKAEESSKFTKVVNDEVFNMSLKKYYHSVLFTQKIKLKNKGKTQIKADVNYMSCTSEFCMPPTNKTVVFDLK